MPSVSISTMLTAAGYTSFLDVPAAFSNLEGLWRPWRGLYTLVSGKASQLDDESGNARHVTQGSGALRPLLGEDAGVVYLEASGGQVLSVPAAFGAALGTNNYTIWAVAETDDLSASECIFATSDTGGTSQDIETTVGARHKGVAVLSNGAAATAQRQLWVLDRSGGTAHLYRNNVAAVLASPTAGVGTPTGAGALFALDTGLTFTWSGRGFEWGGVSGVLTADERADLFAYADALYGPLT